MSAPATFNVLATNQARGLTTTITSEGVTIKLTLDVPGTVDLDLTSTEASVTVQDIPQTAGQATEDSVTTPLSTLADILTTIGVSQTSRRPIETPTSRYPTTITANTSPRTASSTDQPVHSPLSSTHTSASSTDIPTAQNLPTAPIIGIAIGAGIAAFLLGLCLFSFVRFRITRAKRQRHGTRPQVPEPRDRYATAVAIVPDLYGKAELPDAESIQRLERDRSRPPQVPPQVPTELATKPPTLGPHELPCDILRSGGRETWDSRVPRTLRRM